MDKETKTLGKFLNKYFLPVLRLRMRKLILIIIVSLFLLSIINAKEDTAEFDINIEDIPGIVTTTTQPSVTVTSKSSNNEKIIIILIAIMLAILIFLISLRYILKNRKNIKEKSIEKGNRFCGKCGKKILLENKHCQNCGAKQ